MLILSTNVDKKLSETEFSIDWQQMAIENTVSSHFYLCLLIVKRAFLITG